MVELLLQHGANVNKQSTEGHSALQYAASKGWQTICEELLNKKADVDIRDNRGATPLHRAASRGHVKIVKILLDHKANLSTDNLNKQTNVYELK